ncbi:hypothetical protein CANCADRAFT_1200 [Tortispora caseinolytica NRRL Y-17796]|uniref:Major facilitator superfamily (MFS) profile domain-containing protein n=1 Tax=Tortispora caseinolytica NRRL Y-17796 TaxID=767744 RepID=A0A1E4TLJ6_9ASCO|nr:hypothetical protein CANCADRAFT_1200 [Tortispora caseinolytica NRRL Y-17796]
MEKTNRDTSSSKESMNYAHEESKPNNLYNTLDNPLQQYTPSELIDRVKAWTDKHNFTEDQDAFVKGALLARDPSYREGLEDDEITALEDEIHHKWKQPKTLYYLTVMCAMCAVVQGMDETVVNGAQIFYLPHFGIENDTWITGLVNGAPYLCCATLGCFLTDPLNRWLGRRGVIFWSCVIAGLASIWEGFTYSWGQLLAARLVLGLGIGPKSATVPVFAAETSPAPIRGALVMMWQMWTAFGIMLGFVVSLIFMPTDVISENLAWRLMLGSTVVAPIFVCLQVFFVPESPRWYLTKGRYSDAYQSLLRLRNHKILAARDLYYMNELLDISNQIKASRFPLKDIIRKPRNRRAFVASELVMFMQQFCGINVIAYYSSNIFLKYDFSEKQALLASWGFGMLNFVFALPAVYTIDTFGRRSLLLLTFPFLSLSLLFTGFSFWIPGEKARLACVALGVYIFTIFYSPGEGPVPFTYSAEAYPLSVRDFGMSMATATTWGFNFILALTWPSLLDAFKPQGAFGWYAAWNMAGWVMVFFLMPETKGLTLEELDQVFSVPHHKFVKYQIKFLPRNIERYILRRDVPRPPPVYLYEHEEDQKSLHSSD